MKTTLHTLNTPDGTIHHGLIHEPDTETKRVVAHVHGMGGNFYEAFFLQPIAEALTAQGVAFAPFNNKGNGLVMTFVKENDGRRSYCEGGNYRERFEDCVEDIRAHIDFLESQGYEEIHLSGHSLGVSKIIYYMYQTQDPRIASLILLAPADMLGLEQMEPEQFARRIKTAEQMIEDGKGDEIMPEWIWGEYPLTANTYKNLFATGSAAAICNFWRPEDGFDVLRSVKVPIFVAMGTKDDGLTAPIEDVMQLIRSNVSLPDSCETNILQDATHDFYEHKEELGTLVADWVTKGGT